MPAHLSSSIAAPVPVSTLILAAGAARRFGSDKLRHPMPDGRPLIAHTLDAARAALGPAALVVVVAAGNAPLRAELAALAVTAVPVAAAPDATDSLGRSLAAGVAALPATHGILILLADLPFIAPTTIAAVARAIAGGAPLAAPFHAGQRGHPVGFAPAWRDDLLALHGEYGARDLLQRAGTRLQRIVVDDPGCITDIDTPKGLAEALASRRRV